MAHTSTGLKLKGTLGRFGNTDICDIFSILSLPDEKVFIYMFYLKTIIKKTVKIFTEINFQILSGCSWGNILVWEENAIKFEILRKGRKPCHSAAIMQILYSPQSNEVNFLTFILL